MGVQKDIAIGLARKIIDLNFERGPVEELMMAHRAQKPIDAPGRNAHPAINGDDRIAIWKAEMIDGRKHYVRDKRFFLSWQWWARVAHIPPKGNRKRVVLMGESVARGQLYDPHYNPAQELEAILDRNSDGVAMEVVDLAMTGMDIDMLEEVSSSCLALEPDALVIFAGNNWYYTLLKETTFDEQEISLMVEWCDQNAVANLKEAIEHKLKTYVQSFFARLAALVSGRKIPVVFIVPEFNLMDWRSSAHERTMTRLSAEKTRQWMQAKENAERASADCALVNLELFANKLIILDPTNPLGYEFLAESKLKQGMVDDARYYLEQALTTSLFFRTKSTPRNLALNRNLVLAAARRYGFKVVDLQTVFKDHLFGILPGRQFFLDYCHLTKEGIQVAMRQTAVTLIHLLHSREIEIHDMQPSGCKVEPKIEAFAHVHAAIHNAHYGQPYEIVFYHCQKALQIFPSVSRYMVLLCDLFTRRTSSALCRALETIIMEGMAEQYENGQGLLHPPDDKLMDLLLVNAITSALQQENIDIRKKVETLRDSEHGVYHRRIDLLESFYWKDSYYPRYGRKNGFFQGRDICSNFFLMARKNVPVKLRITCRVPADVAVDGQVQLVVNDYSQSFAVAHHWTTSTINVPGEVWCDRENTILIHWPLPVARSNAADPLDDTVNITRIHDLLYPVFGEIHAFTAEACK